jgi:hypothetical protein
MNPEALASELEREPFRPLRLHLSNGRTVKIDDPDVAVISNLSVYLFKVRRDHRRMADDTQVISLRHIVSIKSRFKPLDSGTAGRKGKPAAQPRR